MRLAPTQTAPPKSNINGSALPLKNAKALAAANTIAQAIPNNAKGGIQRSIATHISDGRSEVIDRSAILGALENIDSR